jgi:hypothetical protein
VAAPTGCAWTGSSNDAWLTITAGGNGNGNGNLTYSAAANSSASQRVGTLTVAGQTFTVTQAGVNCTFSISPTSQSAASGGDNGTSQVTTQTGCPWSAESNVSWITVTAGASGTGSGPVSFSVQANPSTTPRSGTLIIASETFTVNQAAASCSVSVAPASQFVPGTGGTGSTNVTAPTGCNWTALSNNIGWLSVPSGPTGTGDGVVTFSAIMNVGAARTGRLTISGQIFTVNQGASCSFAIAPTSLTVAAAGGTASTALTTGATCPWTATSGASWVTVIDASGTGSGAVSFAVAPNTGTTQRSTILSIGGRTLTVTQPASTCTFTISPTSLTVAAAGGTGSTTVTTTTGCAWTATSNAPWITVTTPSGSGTGQAGVSVAANTSTIQRSGTLTIAGRTFAVTQGGATTPTAPAAPAGLRILVVGGGS